MRCPIWGLFSGLQNVPSPILNSGQNGLYSTRQRWARADTKSQQHTVLKWERLLSNSTMWLPQHIWPEKELELKAFGGFEETHNALFHQIPFFFFFHSKLFSFGGCYDWNVQIPWVCFLLFSIHLDFLPQLLFPPEDFAEQLSLHVPCFLSE